MLETGGGLRAVRARKRDSILVVWGRVGCTTLESYTETC